MYPPYIFKIISVPILVSIPSILAFVWFNLSLFIHKFAQTKVWYFRCNCWYYTVFDHTRVIANISNRLRAHRWKCRRATPVIAEWTVVLKHTWKIFDAIPMGEYQSLYWSRLNDIILAHYKAECMTSSRNWRGHFLSIAIILKIRYYNFVISIAKSSGNSVLIPRQGLVRIQNATILITLFISLFCQ